MDGPGLSAWLGFVGSIVLILGPARDQGNRLWIYFRRPSRKELLEGKAAAPSGDSSLAEQMALTADALQERAGRWHWFDSLSMTVGAALLIASFFVELVG